MPFSQYRLNSHPELSTLSPLRSNQVVLRVFRSPRQVRLPSTMVAVSFSFGSLGDFIAAIELVYFIIRAFFDHTAGKSEFTATRCEAARKRRATRQLREMIGSGGIWSQRQLQSSHTSIFYSLDDISRLNSLEDAVHNLEEILQSYRGTFEAAAIDPHFSSKQLMPLLRKCISRVKWAVYGSVKTSQLVGEIRESVAALRKKVELKT